MARKKGGGRLRRAGRRIMRHVRRTAKGASRAVIPVMLSTAAVGAANRPLSDGDSALKRLDGISKGDPWSDSAGNDPLTIFSLQMEQNLLPIAKFGALAVVENYAAKKSGARSASRLSKHWTAF